MIYYHVLSFFSPDYSINEDVDERDERAFCGCIKTDTKDISKKKALNIMFDGYHPEDEKELRDNLVQVERISEETANEYYFAYVLNKPRRKRFNGEMITVYRCVDALGRTVSYV